MFPNFICFKQITLTTKMSSFLGWSNTEPPSNKTQESFDDTSLLNIAVESTGVDIMPNQSNLSINTNAYDPHSQANQGNQGDSGDGSDYVLDSDASESPRSPSSEGGKIRNVERSELIRRKTNKSDRSSKALVKTSSTGNLRVYHKTDLKNKISAVEHRLLMLEKRIINIEKKNNIVVKESGFGVPGIIKIIGGCLILLHIGKYL